MSPGAVRHANRRTNRDTDQRKMGHGHAESPARSPAGTKGMSQDMDTGTSKGTSRESGAVDPVTLEIISNALRSITDETFVALMKSAYSTNIKERRDHSTAIMDASGRLIVQAAQALPIHIASMSGLIACLLEKFAGDIHEGDLFIANDPHTAGGTHLPDINYAMPVFVEGELFGFVANLAHHADVGGMAPGSMAGGMSEIFQEGSCASR